MASSLTYEGARPLGVCDDLDGDRVRSDGGWLHHVVTSGSMASTRHVS